MPLTRQLDSPLALLRKMEREAYRTFHASSPLAKSDHFFNFCVTASSMRDYCLEYLDKVTNVERQPLFDVWAQVPALVAAAEIANSSKHFVLRERKTKSPISPKTRTARMKKAQFIDIYIDADGRFVLLPITRSEISVTLSDGQRLELHLFTSAVVEYWKSYLRSIGLTPRRQPLPQLAAQ